MLLIVRRVPICSCYPPALSVTRPDLRFQGSRSPLGWTFHIDESGEYTVELHPGEVYDERVEVVTADQLLKATIVEQGGGPCKQHTYQAEILQS